MSDAPLGPGYWQASDGKWYPPEQAPGVTPPPAPGAYGVPMGGGAVPGPLASWGQRVVGSLLDGAMILVAAIVIGIFTAILGAISDVLGVLVGIVAYLVYFAYGFYILAMQGARGGTPAKRILGLKVVDATTGQTIGAGKGVVRGLAHIVDGLTCYIGYLFPLWDDKRQTLADKIMTTVVLTDQPKEKFGPEIFQL